MRTDLSVPDVGGMGTLGAALAYAAAGWFIAPVRAGTKHPGSILGNGWEQKTSRDAREVAAWFAGTDHGIALHVGRSGAVVLDVDDPVPGPDLDALLELLHDAPVQRTDREGLRRHILVRMPDGRVVGNASRGLRVGDATIDVRGLNGVIIVAPTIHQKPTGEYAWLKTGPVPACPRALAEQLLDTKPAPGAVAEGAALAFWDALPGMDLCAHMSKLADRFIGRLGERGSGYRHETAKEGARAIAGAGADGHRGARSAMQALRQALRSAAGAERDTDHEMNELIRWAIACSLEERSAPFHTDPCAPTLALAPAPPWPVSAPAPRESAPAAASLPFTRDSFVGELLPLEPEERLQRARDLVPSLADIPELDRIPWREDLKKFAGLGLTAFDAIVRSVHRERRERETAEREARKRAEIAEKGGEIMPSPHAPHAVAEHLAGGLPNTDGHPHRRWWRGDFYRWTGTAWEVWLPEDVINFLYTQTRDAGFINADEETEDWNPGPQRISGVAHALGHSVLYRSSYLDAEDSPQLIAVSNGALTSAGLQPHHPSRFNLFSLPFGYDPHAQCPQWMAFLDDVLPGDTEAHMFLQEWFGYIISGRTDLQKMASLFGPKRCGKGTVARVLEALLGEGATASPTLEKLATQFGEQALIGKRLAVLSDVRWNARSTAEAVPILLAVTGEDSREVPRKNREDWHGKLPVRFMAMGNDAPAFSDASGALAGRMIHVRFRRSFFGREDPSLTPRLMTELPGILNWALRGLAELTARGRFLAPASSRATDDLVQRMSSPVGAFLMDRTQRVMSGEVSMRDLFRAYQDWSRQEEGHTQTTYATKFTSQVESSLEVAYPGESLEVGPKRWDGTRTYQSRFISGITLLPAPVSGASTPAFGAS